MMVSSSAKRLAQRVETVSVLCMRSFLNITRAIGNCPSLRSSPLSIIIVNSNAGSFLDNCIKSIRDEGIPCEVHIVDNASQDGSQRLIAEWSREWNAVKPIFNSVNKGLSAANNQALSILSGKYVLILNPDTVVLKGALKALTDFLDAHPKVGAIGPRNLFGDGRPHTSHFVTWTAVHAIMWKLFPYNFMRGLYDRHLTRYELENVTFVSSSCLMTRVALMRDLGGYDEKFFLSVYDCIDLCHRIKAKGYGVVYFPDASIIHYTGGSSGRQFRTLVVRQDYLESLYYYEKNGKRIEIAVVKLGLFISSFLRGIAFTLASSVSSGRGRRKARLYIEVSRTLIKKPLRWQETRGRLEQPSLHP